MGFLPRTWRRLQAEQKRTARALKTLPARVQAAKGADPAASARAARLRYVNGQTSPGIERLGKPKRFRYVDSRGRTIRDRHTLERIRALAIPPAWTQVWICPDPDGHLQATGRDARGRKQYRYHARWRQVRDEVKYGRLLAFARALPIVRRRTAEALETRGLSREQVLAAVVQLLEKTLIRVGNEEYARQNRSYGLTTLRDQHAHVVGSHVVFQFRGKSGIAHAVDLHDARLARVVKACRDLPGYELFQYVDENGARQSLDSGDVNAYLRQLTGEDFTAKDFRTWAGTVMAARALAVLPRCSSTSQVSRNIVKAVKQVAEKLGNTSAVCRKSYIHPAIFDCYANGITLPVRAPAARGTRRLDALNPDEAAVVGLLQRRLRKTA